MLSSHFLRSFVSVMSSKRLLHKILYVFLVSRILATSSAHLSAINFVNITMATVWIEIFHRIKQKPHIFSLRFFINPLNPELNLICYLLSLLGAHHFLHVSRIRVKLLTFRLLMSYIYGAPILDVSRSHTTTHHSRLGLLWTSDQLVAETST